MVLLIQLFSFFLCFQNVMSFAAWFVTDDLICERPLKVGEIVMNYPIVEDDAKLAIEVYGMDGEVLKSGVIGKAGAKYSVVVVHIDDRPQAKAKGEFILDASEGIFMEEDHCGNKRSLLREAEITVPNQQVDPIEITAGWAAGHMEVTVSKPFVIRFASGSEPTEEPRNMDRGPEPRTLDRESIPSIPDIHKGKGLEATPNTETTLRPYAVFAHTRAPHYTGPSHRVYSKEPTLTPMVICIIILIFVCFAALCYYVMYYHKYVSSGYQDLPRHSILIGNNGCENKSS